MRFTPIVLFVYNRLEHVRKTVQALQRNHLSTESELFIYSDGPKPDDCSKVEVKQVRTFLKSISGFKKIVIVESEQNQGLASSIIQGVSAVIEQYGRVIVLEDDLETAPGFLRFMNEALDAYEDAQQVMQISGHMFNVKIKAETDSIFLPFITSWGWATWKRAWDHFDPSMSDSKKITKDSLQVYKFNLDGAYNYSRMLDMQFRGEIDSWAIRWYLSVFLRNGLTLYPVTTFVRNVGFDGSGTHCAASGATKVLPMPALPEDSNFCFPEVGVDLGAYERVKSFLSSGSVSEKRGVFISIYKIVLSWRKRMQKLWP